MIKITDEWNGINSGYPLCCIIFFCNFWNSVRSKHIMFHKRPECYDYYHGDDFVRCPECVVKILRRQKSERLYMQKTICL